MIIREPETEASLHIDFVPMIDTLFNLLIFFLLATTIKQTEREMKVALPIASAAGPISTVLREIVVNVAADGRIVVAGSDRNVDDLRAIISEAVKQNPQQKVTVRGDRTTAYSNVVRVLDVAKAAGVQEPYLDTVLDR